MTVHAIQHTDKCCNWDDEEFCDCGALEVHRLETEIARLTSALAEKEKEVERRKGEREQQYAWQDDKVWLTKADFNQKISTSRAEGIKKGRRLALEEATKVATSAAIGAERIGKLQPPGSQSRDRMFARSREASNIADDIRALPLDTEVTT